jgi:nitrate reductase NapD
MDRRKFLSGDWHGETAEIASILVQARPDRLEEVARTITALKGTEIHSQDPKGKLVVVIEAPDVGAIGATLNEIALLPAVLSATLVFHATDAA